MPTSINTNVNPYWDDFDADKNFYRVMFKPGYPIQARELTQVQSILSNQIEELSSRFFKNGDNIVPGDFSISVPAAYVRVSSITQGSRAVDYIGYTLTGVTSGVKAVVDYATEATDDDDATFYVTYTSSGNQSESDTFTEGETLESNTPNNFTAAVGITKTSKPIDSTVMGFGSLFTINSGSYYVNGFMVNNEEQTITLDKYNTTPTYQVGFVVVEDFVTSNDDESLLDNAQGHSNFAAPGADRLSITLNLVKKTSDNELVNFIPLVDIIQGNIVGSPIQTIKWDWLYDILAKRTFDESGDYIVSDFPIRTLQYWNDDDTDGVFDPDENGLYPPVPGTGNTDKLTFEQADNFYSVCVSPGSAYVQGYHVGYTNPFYLYSEKPRDEQFLPDTYTNINTGLFVKVSNVYGAPDIENIRSDQDTEAFEGITLYRNFIDGHIGSSFTGTGYYDGVSSDPTEFERRPLNTGNKPWVTYHIICDSPIGKLGEANRYGENIINITKEDGRVIPCVVVYPLQRVTYPRLLSGRLQSEQFGNLYKPNWDTNNTIATPYELPLGFQAEENQHATLKDGFVDPPDGYPIIEVNADYSIVVAPVPNSDGTVPQIIRGDEVGTEGSRAMVSLRVDPTQSGIMRPKYFYPETTINTSKGYFGFNSVYNMGSMDAVYFTELVVVGSDDTKDLEWIPGKMIMGTRSRATAKIEDSRENHITVSNINGEFINHESIFQVQEDDAGDTVTKQGRLIREGEVVDLHFNDFLGSWPGFGGGGDKEENSDSGFGGTIEAQQVYTDDVQLLRNPFGGLRVAIPTDVNTQFDANEYFFNAIQELQSGQSANNINLSPQPPIVANPGDIWISDDTYVVYVWDGNVWVGLTPNPDEGSDAAAAAALISGTSSNVAPVIDDAEGNPVTRLNYSLKDENFIVVGAIGQSMYLVKHYQEIDGTIKNDYTYNSELNKIELTETGRDKIFRFVFFDPQRTTSLPRINYELITENGVRGYAVTSPAKITSTIKKTKSFWSDLIDVNNFSADAALQSSAAHEVTTLANGSTFSGKFRYNYIICDNHSDDASEQLTFGDIIAITNDANITEYKMVTFVTSPYGYGRSRTKSIIYFSTTLDYNITGKQVRRLRMKSFGKTSQSLVYQLPTSVVKSLETNSNVTGIDYKVFREFVGEISTGNTEVTFTTLESNQTFDQSPLNTSIVVAKTSGDVATQYFNDGRVLQLDSINPYTIEDGGRKITYKLSKPVDKDSVIKAIIPIIVTNAKSRRKILKDNYEIEIPFDVDNPDDPEVSPASQPIISLGVTDGYKINSIKMYYQVDEDDDRGLTNDVTDDYIFDDGQRDSYYGLASLVRKTGRATPTGNLVVNMSYFQHDQGTEGDFFSVDSYTHDAGVAYSQIPTYFSESDFPKHNKTEDNINKVFKLRDCIDFRPTLNILEPDPSTIATLSVDKLSIQCHNFKDSSVGGNAIVPHLPIPTSKFKCDIEYYIPKIDSLFLDKTGKMSIISGVPSQNPVPPPDIATGIRLYDIFLPAYTFDLEDIIIKKYNYRRYTMKDIFDIDRRVNRVERLVSLSILELSSLNTSVRDAVTGLDRFKNGIVVDSFENHSKGDSGNDQYRCSIDTKNSHLRPPFSSNQVDLEEANETNEERQRFGYYVNNNNIVTCPYSSVDFLGQYVATRSTNVQRYTSYTYEGKVSLYPSVDTFHDVKKRPKLLLGRSDLYDASLNLTLRQEEFNLGTVWGEWETQARFHMETFNHFGTERKNPITSGIETTKSYYSTNSSTIANQSTSLKQARSGIHNMFDSSTATITDTSYGDRIQDFQLSRTMRSVPVMFYAQNLKPNTRYYIFFDNINVTDWASPDIIDNTYPDKINRYNGTPNSNPMGFGNPLVSDDVGNLSGVFIIPNGRAPETNTKFTGRMEDLQYKTSGVTRSFTTGTRSFKLASTLKAVETLSDISAYATTDFTSSPIMHDKKDSIISTRTSQYTTISQLKDELRNKGDDTVYPIVPNIPTPLDPIGQSFMVDGNSPEGIFITEMDLFFRQKDPVLGVEAYIVPMEGSVPTNEVIPHSRVVKPSDTVIRVVCNITSADPSTTLSAGTTVVGAQSGATGVIKSDVLFESQIANPDNNVSNTTFNVILTNYLQGTRKVVGVSEDVYEDVPVEFIPGEAIIPQIFPEIPVNLVIANDEVHINRIDLVNFGKLYQDNTTTIEISEPELPGGRRASASLKIADIPSGRNVSNLNGQVYEVVLTDAGSGYTKKPSVRIVSAENGVGAEAICRIQEGRKSVSMGVAISDDATAPTTFKFESPVYLMGNKSYAFIVKSVNSMEYKLWTSKIGEAQVGTNKQVSKQFNLGSMFTSQNTGVWSAQQNIDIMFKMRRAKFVTNTFSSIKMFNEPLMHQTLLKDPIETAAIKFENHKEDSESFGENLKVIKVHHNNHGLMSKDFVMIEGVVDNPGGIANDRINGLRQVIDVSLDHFTILTDADLDPPDFEIRSSKSGGSNVRCSFNRPFESCNLYSGVMNFANTTLKAEIGPTEHSGITKYNDGKSYTLSKTEDIPIMDTYYFTGAKQVAGRITEVQYNDDDHLRMNRSCEVNFFFGTSDNKISPVIDLDRTNLITIHNLVDKPLDNDDSSVNGNRIATVSYKPGYFDIGRYSTGNNFTFTDDHGTTRRLSIKNVYNNTRTIELVGNKDINYLVNSPQLRTESGIDDVVTTSSENFMEETTNNGSVYSKWISKLFTFENQCDGIEVKLSSIFYDIDDIKVFYKIRDIGFDGDFSKVKWSAFNPVGRSTTSSVSGSVNRPNIKPDENRTYDNLEGGVKIQTSGLPNNIEIIQPRSADNVDPKLYTSGDWQELMWSVQDLTKFDALSIKIVMTAQNPAKSPVIDDMTITVTE